MSEHHDVVVIGGGQAGLVASHELSSRGVDHVVLERERIAESWRTSRWDSLMFQFPNSVLALPGQPYAGSDPDGFSHHTEVLRLLERYAALVAAPVRESTPVLSLERLRDRWRTRTPDGEIASRAVLVATGPFQRARIPALAAGLPGALAQLHAVDYRNPGLLPDGAVLVVGSGASGAQIAEELVGAGRTVYLCLNRHRRVPRRALGHDVTTWLVDLGLMARTRADWVDGRMPPSVLVTGVDGGHDVDLRKLGARGVVLLGRLTGASGDVVRFADDAEPILVAADEMYDAFVRAVAERAGASVPARSPSTPVPPRPELSLRAAGVTTVIWATGYDFDHGWLHAPCFDATGDPVQRRGVTDVPGLYFLGLHWMHTFGSGTFLGLGDDAAHVAEHLTHFLHATDPRNEGQGATAADGAP
jgi:putative flavoprotein involved in K+ transport